ncbi:MAG: Ppx/GppA family phosphatase [Pseudomonadota bacterium]
MKPVGKVAVIDIGSNSCRMVIYEQAGSALIPYFNEKTMAGLGRDLSDTGRLSPTGKELALKTFHRFRAITASLGIKDVRVVATAAVREAIDGAEFQQQAQDILSVPIQVLSGSDEGRLSALGVNLGFIGAKGLVADLGGSSMELRHLGRQQEGETFLLGPLARAADADLSIEKRRKIIQKHLSESVLLTEKVERLYAVGGAWRNVAAIHMMLTNYPLRLAHGYKLKLSDIQHVVEAADLAKSDKLTREQLQSVSKRRFETLLHAALVLSAVLEVSAAKRVTISSFGLRDGVAAQNLQISGSDALLDSVPLFLRSSKESIAFGKELYSFIHPITDQFIQSEPILRAICLMADAGARMHPDHRAQLVYEQVLRAQVPGMTHEQRLFAAYAVASRYTFKFNEEAAYAGALNVGLKRQAKVLGTAMRLGSVYSGRSGPILASAGLKIDGRELHMRVDHNYRDLVSETVERRLGQLAGLMKLHPHLKHA